jgi:hypothetical protein
MKPARIDWQAFNNETLENSIQIKFVDGSPFDWTEYESISMQIKANRLQPEPDIDLSLSAGLTVSSLDHSVLAFSASMDDVKGLLGRYSYDVIGTHAGDPTLVVTGTIQISQGITT